ncbi:MAG: 2-oxoglutarate dehydrogenase E1 component [Vicinamibacterales bacterium]
MNPWSDFTGANAGFVQELYERYERDPASVDAGTREAFRRWGRPPAPADAAGPGAPAGGADLTAAIGAVTLAESIRRYGHLAATLDPIGFDPPAGDPSLRPESHGLTETALRAVPAGIVGGPSAAGAASALEAIERLRAIYCGTTGHDHSHVFVPEERAWLREAIEARRFRPPIDPVDGREVLDRLSQVEVFERFLQRTFPGKTRFSIEGLDVLIPVLDEIIADAAAGGVRHVLIAMAHRGRLNVLAHVMRKPYAQILAEFKDPLFSRSSRIDLGWMGDVKYHAGARVEQPDRPTTLVITMPPNPSHLEAVDPVLVGMARAAATSTAAAGPPALATETVLGILIHGDAAFPGQGVVAETLNLSRLSGWQVGGTIHIIANNQLGFTADPHESFSTSYASGLARGFKVPIVHVNADDPEASIEAARLAWAYRQRFGLDFLIDLVGYRRHGHNEGDEPAFTQPRLYRLVAAHRTVRQRYAEALVSSGAIPAAAPDEMLARHSATLESTYAALKPDEQYLPDLPAVPPSGAAGRVQTAVALDRLVELNDALALVPDGFTVHKKLERGRERRKAMLATPDDPTVDWAAAEELALASILADGIPIRFTGEDVERGTFSQRHAVLHDAETGGRHVPLQRLPQARASFEIHNTALSELAVLGFEVGYNLYDPRQLVLWEAQYGDFINGAQTILDEYLMSGRAKWGLTPSIVLLLPHGYEGQGPDHSSARVERFLQLAADLNVRIVNCTTAAQYFHVLRRQAVLLATDPLPLVMLTPKSLLRHPMVASAPRALAEGRFLPVIDDDRVAGAPGKVRRLLLCSGKVYVDLASSDAARSAAGVAVVRMEQLYPFPAEALTSVLDRYAKLREVCWVQEEPENMGAWDFVRPELERVIDGRWPLRYIGRVRNSSPSEGSATWHQVNQRALVARAFETGVDAQGGDRVVMKQA